MMGISRPDGALVLVDATSAAGGLRVDPRAFDCYYFAPQKAFASEGGLWLPLCSPAAIGRVVRLGASGRMQPRTLSLPPALQHARRVQPLHTPARAPLLLCPRPA